MQGVQTQHSSHYQLQRNNNTFQLQQVPSQQPALAADQVLIRVGAMSLNYRDLLILRNAGQDTVDGQIPLSDAAGTVIAIGSKVQRWQVGDRVAPNFFPQWQDGKYQTQHYSHGALGGANLAGVLAEHIVASEDAIVAIPAHLSLQEAAALPCAAVTAWHALFERGQLQAGETVLIQGTGGVALFALQLAAAQGAKVIITSSSDEKLARAKALGAWETINYRAQPNWDEVALALTGGMGVDHILELGGPETYARSINALASGGHIHQIGVLTGFGPTPNLWPLQFKNAHINGILVGSVAHFNALNAFLSQHQIRPVIDQEFAYAQASEAFDYLASAQHFGKIVINVQA
ncbi:NAD(P)-dependent alcohol dehydrogenase [Chitinibacter fontanus]|uniref:NAD(P)-dependent alcohol dehydrogenase n=1 Tax=Chitinibacter fontanus TaxID=1737446 RepID=A0A7D5VAW4_9NEIS|nr:NAD(P)-dependent alcohol dehydrogenase [Chitinibacter fontanus]QLI82519.1 NAD(P)-dependent alcohol dehydrogenase [Chitinibacter fontanus]